MSLGLLLFNGMIFSDLLCFVMVLCIFVSVWVVLFLVFQAVFFSDGVVMISSECSWLELLWTLVPSIVVFVLCLTNIECYSSYGSNVSLKPYSIVGHQWYWSYGGITGGEYDSFVGSFMTSVDKPMQLEQGNYYRLLVASEDVIHGFSVPDLGIKIDAIPGRLNSVVFFADRFGVFVGYCTELCGVGHGYMPVVIEIVEFKVKVKSSVVSFYVDFLWKAIDVFSGYVGSGVRWLGSFVVNGFMEVKDTILCIIGF